MNILTFFTPSEITDLDINSDAVVVIDVLRCCTTIAAAFRAGVPKIIPVGDTDKAHMLVNELGKDSSMLGGTFNGEALRGFDFGNSPSEYKPDLIQRKNLIYYSNNLAGALLVSRGQNRILLGCFNNMNAVLESVRDSETVLFLCVGNNGRFALEDAVCAGMFIQYILNRIEHDFSFNDASTTARYLFYRHHRDIYGMLRQSSHGIYLEKLGLVDDVAYAAQTNITNIVPELSLEKNHIIPTVTLDGVLNSIQ